MSRNGRKKAFLGAIVFVYGLIIYAGGSSSSATLQGGDTAVTFNNQVVRILQKNCQVCHHPGDIAPFSLMTYEDAYLWAGRIEEVTQSRYMPPWKPAAGCGEFQNQRGLTDEEIATIAQWVDAGVPEGDPNDLPPLEFPDGWTLGEPDLMLTPEVEYQPDPTGGDIYRCFSIPTNLTEDRYVTRIEIRPGNRSIVHHVLLFVDATGASVALDQADPEPGYTCFGGPGFSAGIFSGWAPGSRPWQMPDRVGILVPAGSRLVMQVHYHPTGEPEADRTMVGLHFADGPIQKQFRIFTLINDRFVIPAGATHHLVRAIFTIPRGFDVHALSVFPHMHLLGREMEVRAVFPNRTTQCLVDISDWDFNWQDMYFYTQPVPIPGGTRLELTAYYDNSANNPNNPNSPPQPVGWGEATTDEMCIAFIGFTID
jgi:mono/diheme cytochrome c family protein